MERHLIVTTERDHARSAIRVLTRAGYRPATILRVLEAVGMPMSRRHVYRLAGREKVNG